MIGFEESQTVGLEPSRTPPCGFARSVDVAEAAVEAAVFVTVFVTAEAMEDMLSVECRA